MTAEQRILAWLERADFDGTGCRHSQDTIAKATGYSRRTVIRSVQALAADGRITVSKERRPGLKWPCNVYHVPTLNPQKRSGVLGVLKAIRDARSTQCHTEGTARTAEGSYAPGTSPSLKLCKRCQHAAGAQNAEGPRRMCQDCAQLREQLARTENLLAKAHDDVMGQSATVTAQGKELARLKRELSDESTPAAQAVRKVLDSWGARHPSANIDPLGFRARVVRGAIKLGHTNPPLPCPVHAADGSKIKGVPKDEMCTVPDELIEAIEGLALVPFTGPKGRCAVAGAGTTRYDGIEYALTDRKTGAPSEATIERFRGIARWAKMCRSERLYEVERRTGEVHERYVGLLLDAIGRENGNGAHA